MAAGVVLFCIFCVQALSRDVYKPYLPTHGKLSMSDYLTYYAYYTNCDECLQEVRHHQFCHYDK